MTIPNVLLFAILLVPPMTVVSFPAQMLEAETYRTMGLLDNQMEAVGKLTGKIMGWSPRIVYRQVLMVTQKYKRDPDLETEDLLFDGVQVRLYKPKSMTIPSPCVIYIHGGGWNLQNLDTYDGNFAQMALKTGMMVVAVNYRLSPEHPYPAALTDCEKVTKYVLQYGHRHGINKQRVAVSGDSAGGNLATVVAMKLAEVDTQSLPSLKLQVLMYPVTQVVNFRTSSYLLYKNYPIQNQHNMAESAAMYLLHDTNPETVQVFMENRQISPSIRQSIYRQYFKKEYIPDYVRPGPHNETFDPFPDQVDEKVAEKMDALALDPYASPLFAQNLSKMPRTYMIVSEFDVLRDDGLLYARRLREADVEVELSFKSHEPHMFMYIFPTPTIQFLGAYDEWEKVGTYIKRHL